MSSHASPRATALAISPVSSTHHKLIAGFLLALLLLSSAMTFPGLASAHRDQDGPQYDGTDQPQDSPSSQAETSLATVSEDLNLRTAPSLDATVLAIMPAGSQVQLTGQAENGFSAVTWQGQSGYASSAYLSGGNTTATPEEEAAPSEPETQPETSAPSSSDDIVSIIYAAADEYGQPREDMLRVAQCESNLDPSAVNASSGASGLFQFMPSTWASTPFADQDIFDPVASANAAGWMWANGRRNEWQCQ